MELMIKYSEISTIMLQAFLITLIEYIVIGCAAVVMRENFKKLKKRMGGNKNLREYICPGCGFSAWTLDRIVDTKCRKCGYKVITKPVPKIERSFIGRVGSHSREFNFIKK
jgi:DNA-directed RNA polymerase subunit RPC12/RpoP